MQLPLSLRQSEEDMRAMMTYMNPALCTNFENEWGE